MAPGILIWIWVEELHPKLSWQKEKPVCKEIA